MLKIFRPTGWSQKNISSSMIPTCSRATSPVSRIATVRMAAGASGADGLADAPHVVVDVVDEDALDGLLGGHDRDLGEHGALLLEVGVGKPPHHRGSGGHALFVERERFGLAAPGVLTGVLGV